MKMKITLSCLVLQRTFRLPSYPYGEAVPDVLTVRNRNSTPTSLPVIHLWTILGLLALCTTLASVDNFIQYFINRMADGQENWILNVKGN